MSRKIIVTATVILLAVGSVFAQPTGGDKHGRSRNSAQPPDPLVSHKSPGRSKRSKRRHHKRTPNGFTVKQKTKGEKD
jgi:hypothetical protein